jgi:hypothetical protein
VVAARKQKQKRMSAQVVEDEDYQLRYEVAAGVDVAKESAVVCVRMPPAAGRKHRTSHLHQHAQLLLVQVLRAYLAGADAMPPGWGCGSSPMNACGQRCRPCTPTRRGRGLSATLRA